MKSILSKSWPVFVGAGVFFALRAFCPGASAREVAVKCVAAAILLVLAVVFSVLHRKRGRADGR